MIPLMNIVNIIGEEKVFLPLHSNVIIPMGNLKGKVKSIIFWQLYMFELCRLQKKNSRNYVHILKL